MSFLRDAIAHFTSIGQTTADQSAWVADTVPIPPVPIMRGPTVAQPIKQFVETFDASAANEKAKAAELAKAVADKALADTALTNSTTALTLVLNTLDKPVISTGPEGNRVFIHDATGTLKVYAAATVDDMVELPGEVIPPVEPVAPVV